MEAKWSFTIDGVKIPSTPTKTLNLADVEDMKLSDVVRVLHAQGKRLKLRISERAEASQ